MIEFGHLSHPGLRRALNEDTYHGDLALGLWLVADGMGGHDNGEIASAIARESIVREVRDGTPLVQAIAVAGEDILRSSRLRADTLPMGTTAVALRVQGNRFEVGEPLSQRPARASSKPESCTRGVPWPSTTAPSRWTRRW